VEEGIEGAHLAEDGAHTDGANEWRKDHRGEGEGGKPGLEWKVEAITDPCEGESESEGDEGAADGHEEGVPEALEIDGVAEDFQYIGERRATEEIDESTADALDDGPEEEDGEEDESEEKDEPGSGLRHWRKKPEKSVSGDQKPARYSRTRAEINAVIESNPRRGLSAGFANYADIFRGTVWPVL
jgi:hypothetical protein